jgi:hypothetical protein
MALAEVTQYGAERYARDNWRLIEEESHINHALIHIFAYQAGNTQDDHLEHAFCRLMFALAKKIRPNYYGHAEAIHANNRSDNKGTQKVKKKKASKGKSRKNQAPRKERYKIL